MYQIDYNSYRSVKGFNRRVRFLVMHYTAIDFKASVTALTGSSVSAHYLVPDPSERTYIEAGFKDMRILIWWMKMSVHGMQVSANGLDEVT